MATAEEIQAQWNTYSPQRMEDVYKQMWQGNAGYAKTNKTKSGSKGTEE